LKLLNIALLGQVFLAFKMHNLNFKWVWSRYPGRTQLKRSQFLVCILPPAFQCWFCTFSTHDILWLLQVYNKLKAVIATALNEYFDLVKQFSKLSDYFRGNLVADFESNENELNLEEEATLNLLPLCCQMTCTCCGLRLSFTFITLVVSKI
jgi:hypothetical protein